MNEIRPPGCEGSCKKPCTIHLTQIINGKVHKVDLCETCPHAKHMKNPMEFGLMEKLLGVALQKGVPIPGALGGHLECQACGYTENEFKKTGRLGCPTCYNVFMSNKVDFLRQIQNSTLHKGKIPKHLEEESIDQNIDELQSQLQGHLQREEYEQAAILRDKIKKLKKD